jgi:hypothetical protein
VPPNPLASAALALFAASAVLPSIIPAPSIADPEVYIPRKRQKGPPPPPNWKADRRKAMRVATMQARKAKKRANSGARQ